MNKLKSNKTEFLKEKRIKNMITTYRPLDSYYQDEDGVFYYEGCDILGYMEHGDSFLFSQGSGFEKGKDKRVIFCISRYALEKLLKYYPKKP